MGLFGFLASLVALTFILCSESSWKRCITVALAALFLSVPFLSSFLFATGCGLLVASLLVGFQTASSNSVPSSQRLLRTIAFGCPLLAFASVCFVRTQETMERVAMRDQLPYESLRDRIEPVNSTVYEIESGTDELDQDSDSHPAWGYSGRIRAISWVHKSAVAHFLETPDFGVMRMGYPSMRYLEHGDGDPVVIPDDSEGEWYIPSTEDAMNALALSTDHVGHSEMQKGHGEYASWFLQPSRYGQIKDLDQVAGFLPHAFTRTPSDDRNPQYPLAQERTHRWERDIPEEQLFAKLTKLQLLGLLYHEEPVVYELDTMPELVSAETAETRALDSFEQRGLERLLAGDKIHLEQTENQLRMLGPLRNAKSCQDCHEGPSNQLLGAFSYTMFIGSESPLKSNTRQMRNGLDGTPLTAIR